MSTLGKMEVMPGKKGNPSLSIISPFFKGFCLPIIRIVLLDSTLIILDIHIVMAAKTTLLWLARRLCQTVIWSLWSLDSLSLRVDYFMKLLTLKTGPSVSQRSSLPAQQLNSLSTHHPSALLSTLGPCGTRNQSPGFCLNSHNPP